MNLLRTFVHTLALASAIAAFGACGDSQAEIGGHCDTPGNIDECVSGAVCANDAEGNHCRKSCTDQAQCASTENCNGISGSNLKACQPK
jgi:hypothetical protein